MRPILIAVCLACTLVALAAGWTWQRWLNTEISPAQYGALYGLRRMDPAFFREKLLPGLEAALADGKLTNGELRDITANAAGLGRVALEAYATPSLDEKLSESLEGARRKGEEAGRSLGDTLGRALDDLSGFIQRKSDELTAPREKPEPPATF